VLQQQKWTCIADVLTMADGPGGGIGKHLAADFLFEVAIHPDTPSFCLCNDAVLYGRLRTHLPIFMQTWVSKAFLTRCGGRTNSRNPFAFNTTSNDNFLASYVKVYRRDRVRVPAELYNTYLEAGAFDAEHILGMLCSDNDIWLTDVIGTPYLKHATPTMKAWKEVEVQCFEAPGTNRYHIFLAQVPSGWPVRKEVSYTPLHYEGSAHSLFACSPVPLLTCPTLALPQHSVSPLSENLCRTRSTLK
jgi:hypothetical protein